MSELTQITLTLVIVTITVVIVFLGVEVYHILGEIRHGFQKMNKMLDDAGLITESIAKPLANASGFFAGIKSGAKFFSGVFGSDEKDKDKEKTK